MMDRAFEPAGSDLAPEGAQQRMLEAGGAFCVGVDMAVRPEPGRASRSAARCLSQVDRVGHAEILAGDPCQKVKIGAPGRTRTCNQTVMSRQL